MEKRSDWKSIEKKAALLTKLFKRNTAELRSVLFRRIHHVTNHDFIYGEIDFLSFHNILEKANPKPNEVFYDLGSGAGKAVFAAALYFNFSKCYGIELLSPLYNKALNTLSKAELQLKNTPSELSKISSIHFIQDSFLEYDFHNANVIYIAATCFSETTWESLINKMATLPSGTRIIVATKNIQHERFDLIYQGVEIMSWGLCTVSIYKILGQTLSHGHGSVAES
jgi:tRNA G46 methylase TrmB